MSDDKPKARIPTEMHNNIRTVATIVTLLLALGAMWVTGANKIAILEQEVSTHMSQVNPTTIELRIEHELQAFKEQVEITRTRNEAQIAENLAAIKTLERATTKFDVDLEWIKAKLLEIDTKISTHTTGD